MSFVPKREYAPFIFVISLLMFIFGIMLGMNFQQKNKTSHIANFADCAAAGNPVMESYPRRCMTPDGLSFTEDIEPVQTLNPEEEQIFCTMDAKVCSDGSSVGRVPPTCEFAPCPGE